MDWSQFADPQFLLGVGVVAFGAINAYILRRQNQQAAAEGEEHTEEQEAVIVERPDVWQSINNTEFSGDINQAIQGEEGEEFKPTDEALIKDVSAEAHIKLALGRSFKQVNIGQGKYDTLNRVTGVFYEVTHRDAHFTQGQTALAPSCLSKQIANGAVI
ncbi:hypothetical protein TcWFU_004783 [Taenia crassiceps]|uniref:Uncharacterized protein n=1 Tax=Taenia crassiceps TaxID=6207 RepID=A0ABR4Q5S3_9CEST